MAEKRMVENYEITQGIRIGDKEVVLGMDENAEYLTVEWSIALKMPIRKF